MDDDFRDRLLALLPTLRVQALALTDDRSAADDLVQDAMVAALAARADRRLAPGAGLAAWLRQALHHRHARLARRRGGAAATVSIEALPPAEVSWTAGAEEDRLIVKELRAALRRLAPAQREALLLVALRGMSYEEVAEATGVAPGTAKSRVSRARRELHDRLAGAEPQVTSNLGWAARRRLRRWEEAVE